MNEEQTMHATFLLIGDKGVLIKGKSGSGKSDLALRLIENLSATLVADDVVLLGLSENEIIGRAPENLQGLLEVRGVGIAKYNFATKAKVDLVVELVESASEIERLPKQKQMDLVGVKVGYMKLMAKESSAVEKVLVKLRDNLLNEE